MSERSLAAFGAGASLLAGKPIAAIIERWREHVAANTKRLTTAQ